MRLHASLPCIRCKVVSIHALPRRAIKERRIVPPYVEPIAAVRETGGQVDGAAFQRGDQEDRPRIQIRRRPRHEVAVSVEADDRFVVKSRIARDEGRLRATGGGKRSPGHYRRIVRQNERVGLEV